MNTIISQAMATGLPVIATNHSGLPEQVINGENGLVVPEGNPEKLAEAIAYLIEHPELWAEFGRFGRKHAKQNYDSKRLIERQIAFYSQLISNSAKE